MPKRFLKRTSLITALFFVISMLTGSIAAAEIIPTSDMTPFRDLKTSHWGIKDIVKMNLRGVVSGYDDGNFQPDKPVSQIEALLMAVHNMGAEAQLAAVNTNQTLPFPVPAWVEKGSKKEVLLAIEKGLLVPGENNFSASNNATRAWVAQLMVRMINKNSEAVQLANQTPAFTDGSTIPGWALGYINAALKYKLVSGYPDYTFKPNQNVTRAEMVSMLSRSEQYLNLTEKIVTAKIVSVTGLNLAVTVNGSAKNFYLTTETRIFNDKGRYTGWTNLKPNDNIKLLLDGNIIKYIEQLPAETAANPATQVNTIKGAVLQVIPKEKVIVIRDDAKKIHTKTLAATATISAPGSDINSLSQLSAGQQVELSLNNLGDVTLVRLLSGSGSTGGTTGFIVDINQEQKLLIIKTAAGKFNSYQYSDQAVIKIANQRFPGIKDLQVGDEVKLKVEADLITEIELVQAKQLLTVAGKIMLISSEKRILTVQKDNGSLEAFPVADNVDIKIPGLSYPQLSNLLVNDLVELTVEQGKITVISVKNRTVENVVKGTVAAVDTTNRILTLKTEKDELKAYEVNSRAEFLINDRSTNNLAEIRKDMRVEVQLADNKIIYLETKNTIEGNVVTLDQNRRVLTLKIANADSKTYVLANYVDIDLEGDSNPDYNDISLNDYIEARLDDNVITKINVRKTYSYQITDIYKNTKDFKVKDRDGNIRYLYLTGKVEFVVPGKTAPTIDDFAVNNNVKATFLGHKLTKVEVLPETRGQITAINTYANTVTVQSFAGTASTITFTTGSEVINSLQRSTQLSALAVGDRVEVKEKTDGALTFRIMRKITGKYQSVSDNGNKIFITKDAVTWTSYDLAAGVYMHSGPQLITARNLLINDQVELYVLDDILYELEKK